MWMTARCRRKHTSERERSAAVGAGRPAASGSSNQKVELRRARRRGGLRAASLVSGPCAVVGPEVERASVPAGSVQAPVIEGIVVGEPGELSRVCRSSTLIEYQTPHPLDRNALRLRLRRVRSAQVLGLVGQRRERIDELQCRDGQREQGRRVRALDEAQSRLTRRAAARTRRWSPRPAPIRPRSGRPFDARSRGRCRGRGPSHPRRA
jgi:hypothetical protein